MLMMNSMLKNHLTIDLLNVYHSIINHFPGIVIRKSLLLYKNFFFSQQIESSHALSIVEWLE